MTQESLFDAAADAAGLCRYGETGTCTKPATHRAHGLNNNGHHAVRDCCREHADYYAGAWCPFSLKMGFAGLPGIEAAWVEIIHPPVVTAS